MSTLLSLARVQQEVSFFRFIFGHWPYVVNGAMRQLDKGSRLRLRKEIYYWNSYTRLGIGAATSSRRPFRLQTL